MAKNRINIYIISVIFILISVILYGKSGNILVDFSRECYIPYQMIQGEKLCKDIFLIYGPFGYLFNMLLYKIDLNINLLLIEALIVSYFICLSFYLIVKKFTTKTIAIIFTVFFLAISINSPSVFSFTLPYSYSTLWAIFAIYLILLCILYKKDKPIYLLLGFIAVNRLELFALTFLFIIANDIYRKKLNILNYLQILIIPLALICMFNFSDCQKNLFYIFKMIAASSIKHLYKGMGSIFEIKYFVFNLFSLLFYSFISWISYVLFKKNKFISMGLLVTLFLFINSNFLIHLSFFTAVILTCINRKKIKQKDIILLFFSGLLCSKSIFATDFLNYANFGICLILFYIYRQLSLLTNKKWLFYHLIIFIVFTALWQAQIYYTNPKIKFNTTIGKISLFRSDYRLFCEISDFLDNNLKDDESFIVTPEGQIINLIYKRPWKFYNSTFTPLDFETFGEDKIINKLKENKSDYIIFYPRDTQDYGVKNICIDYGVDFCSYILDNYDKKEQFGSDRKALIYKIHEK